MFENIFNNFIEWIYEFVVIFDLTSPIRVVILIADFFIVSLLIYYFYKIMKKTRAIQIFKGILLIFSLFVVAKLFNMVLLDFILTNFLAYGILLLIVVFQPELRSVFERLGRKRIIDVFDTERNIIFKHAISEIVKATEIMSKNQIGALIVIQRDTKVSEVLKEGVALNAKVSSELIQNIFTPKTPLHDGAIVIEESVILAAKCILPLSSEVAVPKHLGTRHRAAVGITEISDAIVIVVSEETGTISLVESGRMIRNLSGDSLKELLFEKMDKSQNSNVIKSFKENGKKEEVINKQ